MPGQIKKEKYLSKRITLQLTSGIVDAYMTKTIKRGPHDMGDGPNYGKADACQDGLAWTHGKDNQFRTGLSHASFLLQKISY